MPRKPDEKSSAYLTTEEFEVLKDLFRYLLELKFSIDPNVLKRNKQYYDRICALTDYRYKTIRNWYLPSGNPKISEHNLRHFCDQFVTIEKEFGNEQAKEKDEFYRLFFNWVKPICERMKWDMPVKRNEISLSKAGETVSDDESSVSDHELLKAISILRKYYNKPTLSKQRSSKEYLIEERLFAFFESTISIRQKNESKREVNKKLAKIELFRSLWDLYELKGDKIIQSRIDFGKIGDSLYMSDEYYGFFGPFHYLSEKNNIALLGSFRLDVLHQVLCLRSDITQENEISHVTNIVFPQPSVLKIDTYVGHKMNYNKKTGACEFKTAVLCKASKEKKRDISLLHLEYEIYSPVVPDHIRTILFGAGELHLGVKPFRNLPITIYELFDIHNPFK